MLATTSTQRNTATTRRVQRPDVSLSGFAGLVETMLGQEPAGQRERILKGAQIVMAGHIRDGAEMGHYLIESCEPGAFYRVSSLQCSCPDSERRAVTCKHRYSIMLLNAASGEAMYERHQAEWRARQDARQQKQGA